MRSWTTAGPVRWPAPRSRRVRLMSLMIPSALISILFALAVGVYDDVCLSALQLSSLCTCSWPHCQLYWQQMLLGLNMQR